MKRSISTTWMQLLVLMLILLLLPVQVQAKGWNYQVSPEEYQPYKKPIGVFSDSTLTYSMGSYGTSFPITLPPARNSLTPRLGLEYNSNGGPTTLGRGWDLRLFTWSVPSSPIGPQADEMVTRL